MKKISVFLLALAGCSSFSNSVKQADAGLNGSFEVVSEGLPVNWLVYNLQNGSDSDFDFSVVENQASDGQRAAYFDIRRCSKVGGYLSPGLATEIKVEGNRKYRVSFDLRNVECHLRFEGGPVGIKMGDTPVLLDIDHSIAEWTPYAFDIDVPSGDSLIRLQWNWLSQGRAWLDHVQVVAL